MALFWRRFQRAFGLFNVCVLFGGLLDYPKKGMLLQLDGSTHAWLEDRGPILTLLLAVDDATGSVPAALFQKQEATPGCLLLVQEIVRCHGICAYTDATITGQVSEPWKVVTCQTKSAILGTATSTQTVMIWAVLGSLGLATLAALMLSRRLAAPIQNLVQGVRRFQSGDLSFQIQPNTSDEVADIATSFNSMAKELADQIGELANAESRLEEANQELEARVEARTNELSIANEGLSVEVSVRTRAEGALFTAEKEQRRLAREYATLAEVGRIISSSLDIDEVYQQFAQVVRKLLTFDRIAIMSRNPDLSSYTNEYVLGTSVLDLEKGRRFSLRGTIADEVVRTASPRILQPDDPEDAVRTYPATKPFIDAGLRSYIGSPLISNDLVIGVLSLRSKKPHAYSPRDLELLTSVGDQIAGAVANAQLHKDREKANKEIAVIGDITKIITSSLDIGQVYEQFAEQVERLVDFDRIAINVLDPSRNTVTVSYVSARIGSLFGEGEVAALEGTQSAYVLETKRALITKDMAESGFPNNAVFARDGLRSIIVVPLISKGEVAATLILMSQHPDFYGAQEQAMLERLAAQIAPAIENARLYKDVRGGNQRLRALSQRLVEVQEQERRHIARELHDEVGQVLTGIMFSIEGALRSRSSERTTGLLSAQGQISELMDRVRKLSLDLRPSGPTSLK